MKSKKSNKNLFSRFETYEKNLLTKVIGGTNPRTEVYSGGVFEKYDYNVNGSTGNGTDDDVADTPTG